MYAGKRINYMFIAGYPNARISMARKFVELGGFKTVFAHFNNPEIPLVFDHLSIFMRTMADVSVVYVYVYVCVFT